MTTTHQKNYTEFIKDVDPEIIPFLDNELARQRHKIELIASENFTSLAVMQAQGTWLTNKYAEGLPQKRYYGGCEWVDEVEQLAINRAKQLFKSEHANVQPHSGAQANAAVYFALLSPGDTVLGMDLSHGGHLSHGSPVNMSGSYYQFIPYGVNKDTEQIDYDQLESLALTHRPKLIVGGASAYSRTIDFNRMGDIAKKAGALFMVDMAHIAGLVAAGLHPSPVGIADVVTTTTHKTLRGPRGGLILCRESLAKQINKSVFPGTQGGPLMHVIAAKAIAFKEALSDQFRDYQNQVVDNARTIGEALVANGFKLVSGGTDNHLVLVDLRNKSITGKAAEAILDDVGITVNKNTVPFETESPFVTSGIRIGTPAITSRGMGQSAAKQIAVLISRTIQSIDNELELESIKQDIRQLTDQYPLYPELG